MNSVAFKFADVEKEKPIEQEEGTGYKRYMLIGLWKYENGQY